MSFNTFPQNPFPPNSENAGGGGSPYVLPIASSEKLGGVKVGAGLSIDANGVLSAPVLNYSTTEQATGQKWIDGKEIYFRVFAFDNTSAATVTIQTTGIDILINSKIISASGNGVQLNYPYFADNGDKIRWYLDSNKDLIITRGDYPIISGYIVLWYTKTEIESEV